MRLLITGAAGLIGRALARSALEAGPNGAAGRADNRSSLPITAIMFTGMISGIWIGTSMAGSNGCS